MGDPPPTGLRSPPLGNPELEALGSMDVAHLLEEMYMEWEDAEEPCEATFVTGDREHGAGGKRGRYKPRTGVARERNIEIQRRYRQRLKERARSTETAVAAAAAEVSALRAENAALRSHYDALQSLTDYSHAALSALRTFSATLAAAAGSYFHAAQLRMATLHAATIEAMFNAVRRPTDAQLRALAADMDINSPLVGRVNIELQAQLVAFLEQWAAAGPHGRMVVERKLKIMFEARARYINMLVETYPEKAVVVMERLRLQGHAALRGSVAAAAEESSRRASLTFLFRDGPAAAAAAQAGDNVVEALGIQSAAAMGHPDFQAAVQLSAAQIESLREAWAAYVRLYNDRIRPRVATAVRELETSVVGDGGEGPPPSLAAVAGAQGAGHAAAAELEAFSREELYARVALTQRAFKVLNPIQMAHAMLQHMPHTDVVMMYRSMLAVCLEEVPEAARPYLAVYFEEDEDEGGGAGQAGNISMVNGTGRD